jgi:hypothetical protein
MTRAPVATSLVVVVVVAVAGAAGCEENTEPLPPAELGTFPYHPLVFELDLSILAYQLHGQTLVWPIDPYYEEHAGGRGTSRDTMMALVRGWAQRRGAAQVAAGAGLDAYRGPGALAGLADNATHDPIIYDYARIHPWSAAITNNDDMWTEYLTPAAITQRIRDVYVSARPIGGDGTTVELAQLAPGRQDWAADATDVLCAFEGGTGDKGLPDRPAAYSLMGFVLVRDTPGGGFDLHVTFRGSRSGSAFRAATEAFDSDEAKGNPDWITDLAWETLDAANGASAVTTIGGVHRGFAHAMTSILPGAFACIANAAALRPGVAPTNIYVTGHSLGGGLAQDFASAVLLGDRYGPAGAGPLMPDAARAWPWTTLKLVSFSAPRAGDYRWAKALSEGALESPFYDPGPLEAVDADALLVLDPYIVDRLHDPTRPAGFRVLVSTDPITTTTIGGDGTHVGTTVYVNGTSFIDWIGVVDAAGHEPANVRADMTEAFDDARTPPVAWRYREVAELVPDRNADEKGTPLEMEKLAAGLRRYYADNGLYFAEAAFTRDLELRFAIEHGGAE